MAATDTSFGKEIYAPPHLPLPRMLIPEHSRSRVPKNQIGCDHLACDSFNMGA